MDALINFINQVTPIAKAIAELSEKVEEIGVVDKYLKDLHERLAAGELRLTECESLAEKAKDVAHQARAEVIQARSQVEQMVIAAKAEAQRTVDRGKADAQLEIQHIRNGFKEDKARLQKEINGLHHELETLETEVIAKRKDHDAVEASLDSLAKRIRGAA